MKITTLGRGTIGGTLGRLWTKAGHEVTMFGRDGGDVSDADTEVLGEEMAEARAVEHARHADDLVVREP